MSLRFVPSGTVDMVAQMNARCAFRIPAAQSKFTRDAYSYVVDGRDGYGAESLELQSCRVAQKLESVYKYSLLMR